MAKKRGKPVSFDAMVKFFIHTYNIPTKRDVDRIADRLDRIERLIVSSNSNRNRRGAGTKSTGKQTTLTASNMVLEIIRRYQNGVGFAEIKLQTGYGEKKLRNIIFRLHKQGKIKRLSRGIYIKV